MTMKKFFLIFILFLFNLFLSHTSFAASNNIDAYPFASSSDAARFQTLSQNIRCVVCQNQTIADSDAPLANDLRRKIYDMIIAHQTNATIQHYLIKRYGDFILFEPRIKPSTLLLWGFPFVGIIMVIIFVIRSKQHYSDQRDGSI